MTTTFRGVLSLGTPASRAILLAGALAESAIAPLNLSSGAATSTTLLPRITDLPPLLIAGSVLSAPNGSFLAKIHASRIEWLTSVPALAHTLSSSESI
jgi:hypothetical protein